MPKLVNLGSVCIDHVYRVPALAGSGETVASLSQETFAGGKGLNQSLAAARAGAVVHHVGCAGSDGDLLRAVLREAGVRVDALRTEPDSPSGAAFIQVNDRGENAIVIAGGANRCITDADRTAARALLEPGDWLLLQNEINDLPEALGLARGTGAKVALNLAPVDAQVARLDLAAVDLLIVNEIESRALVPAAVAEAPDETVARWLVDACPRMEVVLTRGSAGLVHASAGAVHALPAFTVAAEDETAAGDAFIGYLLAALLEGRSMDEALLNGSAAGALAVTVAGAASSIPARDAVLELLTGADQTLLGSPVSS